MIDLLNQTEYFGKNQQVTKQLFFIKETEYPSNVIVCKNNNSTHLLVLLVLLLLKLQFPLIFTAIYYPENGFLYRLVMIR